MSPLELLQLFIHGRLASESYFSDIGLYLLRPRRKADGSVNTVPQITQKIEEALNGLTPKGGKAGVAVTVFMPFVTVPDADSQSLFDVGFTVRVQENPLINMSAQGTRKSAESIGLEVIRALNGFVPHGISSQLYCDRAAMAFNEAVSTTSGKWTYDVTISTKMELDEPKRVAIPRITVTGTAPGAVVEIACATVGAAIYYTLNDSFPSAANTAAIRYSGPVTVDEGGSVFAAAYIEGRSGSNVAYAEVVPDGPTNAMRNEARGLVYSEDGSIATSEG